MFFYALFDIFIWGQVKIILQVCINCKQFTHQKKANQKKVNILPPLLSHNEEIRTFYHLITIISIRFARFVSREFRITKLFFRSQRELKLFSKEQLSLCFVLFRKNSNYLICLISGGMVLMIYFQFMYVCVKTMPTPKERKANIKLKPHYNNSFQICLGCKRVHMFWITELFFRSQGELKLFSKVKFM